MRKHLGYYIIIVVKELLTMKCKVELYVAGKTFNEHVYAHDYAEAERVALARNPNARVISINADFFTDDNWN